MLDDILIHSCGIKRPIPASQNEYGEEIIGGLPVESACRFYRAKGKMIVPESGEHHIAEPKLMLPPTADIADGDIITSSIVHFEGPYRVEHVEPLTDLFSDDIDHFECYLKAVE